MSHFLEAKSVSKAYPGESLGALNGVSFSLEQGKIQSFIGESGSGKSTLLRLLAGLLKPDEGEILFKGKALENPEEQLIAGHAAIRMVFQDFDLMPNMTVAENLRYPLLNYNKDFARDRVSALLALCKIEALAHKKPRELSGGQQQRVALARALADEPELLLMDEPFSQLDPVNKAVLIQEILHILRVEEVGLVLVTHDVRDALMISDRVGFLQNGRLLQNDSPRVIYDQPANFDIASFLGHVNVFEASQLLDLLKGEEYQNAQKLGIRAAHFTLAPSSDARGVEITVEQSFFQGDRYLIRAKDKNGNSVSFYHPAPLSANERQKLVFNPENVLFFSS